MPAHALTGVEPAYTYAQSAVMRSGTSRSNFTSPKVFVAISGVHYATARAVSANRVLQDSLTITQSSDDTPDTCVFKMLGTKPSPGEPVVITMGSKNNLWRYFGGSVLSVSVAFVEAFASPIYEVRCIDWSWHLTRRLVSKLYTSESATDIAADLLTDTLAFDTETDSWNSSTPYIETGLPTLDTFSVTNETVLTALRRLAKRVGCYFDTDYHRRIRFATSTGALSQGTDPEKLSTAHASVTDLTFQTDNSQLATRIISEGGGSNALTAVAVAETVLPVTDAGWYKSTGGLVRAGYDRLAYTGVDLGGAGSLVGLPASPAHAPAAAPAAGAGITAGAHYWAYTFVTGAGESLPSPISDTVTTGTLSAPPGFTSATAQAGGTGPAVGVSVSYAMTYSIDVARANETALGSAITVTGNGHFISLIWENAAPMLGLYLNIYRNDNGGGYKLLWQQSAFTSGTYAIGDSAVTLATSAPVSSGATVGQAALTGIAIGPTGVTSRKVYRTAAGGSQLMLQSTIANNTATTLTDSTADGSLGANVPIVDTSALTTQAGVVPAGSTSLLLASTVDFNTSGGWVVIGNGKQIVRYTGISSSSLTGVPASGAGAITAAVAYGSTATAAPALTGVSSITAAIPLGEPINVVCVVEDSTASAALATAIGNWPVTDWGGVTIDTLVVEDGIVDIYISDNRLSENEATLRAYAQLELVSDPLVTVRWSSRDLNTAPGRQMTLDLSTVDAWLTGEYVIQSVTISNFQTALFPTFTAEATSLRFSFEDLLRQERRS